MEEAALGCPPGEARLIAASPNQTAVTIVYELRGYANATAQAIMAY